MRLKEFVFVLVVLSLPGSALTSNNPPTDIPVALFSYSDTSCGAWAKSKDVEVDRAQYYSWFRGFVSGYNYGNQDNQVRLGRMPSDETLALFVDKFCNDHPLSDFVAAAFDLVKELR